jgi:hypothetical protein
MIPFPKKTSFYAFANGGEFVQWSVLDDDTLSVLTLRGHTLMFAAAIWKFEKTFFGPGRILLHFTHNGHRYEFQLRICPISEKEANGECFWAGFNGPLNTKRFPLSEVLQTNARILGFDS